MTNSTDSISIVSERADVQPEHAGGCDSTFFARQEAAVQRIREMMAQSDDPRVTG